MIASNRPARICPEIAAWVQRALRAAELNEVELVDLQEIDLPFLDEPIMPAQGLYEHEHTARWSELVQSYNGFVFVFPQYNWGYPAMLTNDGSFRDIDAAFADYLGQVSALAFELNHIVNGYG